MKIIFLDFDGVMDTAYYDHVLNKTVCQETICLEPFLILIV